MFLFTPSRCLIFNFFFLLLQPVIGNRHVQSKKNNSPKHLADKRGITAHPGHPTSEMRKLKRSDEITNKNFSFPVHPKYGQKRPESSPIPSSMHHHSQQQQQQQQATVMPAHMNSQSLQQMHQQAQQQQKSQNNLQSSSNSRSNEQSFAAALRSLAKQQIDIKDEDMAQQGGENKNSNNNSRQSEKEMEANRQASASRGIQYDNRATDMRNLTSPQPPEKKVKLTVTNRV